jgi:hypothetical protein
MSNDAGSVSLLPIKGPARHTLQAPQPLSTSTLTFNHHIPESTGSTAR